MIEKRLAFIGLGLVGSAMAINLSSSIWGLRAHDTLRYCVLTSCKPADSTSSARCPDRVPTL
jgi:3-hydroxyisobutyrate dehydrogenase-like beta-hydroxyacid dehydrogenase